ncbi:uncharacterized protein LOC126694685 [Quercus robur]|uniref:uncharacterized protein LOC126694685 n=1 Tax=Quercus robur TaxID=38942 RepID=UPI0021638C7E|nr:uncharacterized protein LOC126694685 [Quercus robur]
MPSIDPSVITHRLNECPSSKLVRQKKRVFAPKRDSAIKDEVQKLMVAKFIREVYYPDWLANVVMFKKANGYNQIRMDEADQEKTSFVTSQGLFCYKVMPFGLKNAGATYQRLVNHMFRPQIGRNVEVYVDDMLVKSQDEGRHLDDLQETFETLRQYHMKLNPSKCAFGVSSGKFLGFMVSHRGIEANPDKIQAILDMKPPQNTKEIQSLTGRVAALNRFVSKATDKCLPFFKYQATNNEVEYEALLKGLELAKSVEAKSICVMGDSQLIMGQVNGMYEAKEERMKKYLGRVMRLVKRFENADFIQIPREENMEADTIAKEVSADESLKKSDEVQYMPSIDVLEVQQVDNRENWMTPIISYLKDGRLPEEKDEARKVRVRSARYVLMNEVLYKRGFSQPYLRCLASDEANYVLREVHEGACGNHSRARSLVHKVVRAGYYWPNMQADAKAYVKVCDQCQRFSNVPRQPSEYLTPMVASWPFAQWGLDILGPFPLGVRQMKFLVVGIDYFTKWVEAEPLANITQQNVKNFVWKNIGDDVSRQG